MKNDEVVFDDLNDLVFIDVTSEGNEGEDIVDMQAAYLDLDEEEDTSDLPIVYIDDEGDLILSPFTGKPDVYPTHRSNIYGCFETDKEFRVILKQMED